MVSKKRSKKFNISNKLAYTLMIIALVVGLGVGVIALSAGETPNPGHNIQSVGPPDTCSAGQVLTFTGSSWSCTTPTATLAPPSGCAYDQALTWTGSSWSCKSHLRSDQSDTMSGQLWIDDGGSTAYALYVKGGTTYTALISGNLRVSGTCSGGTSCDQDIAERWISENALKYLHCDEDKLNYLDSLDSLSEEERTVLEDSSCVLDSSFTPEFESGDVVCFDRLEEGIKGIVKNCNGAYDKTALSTINNDATFVIGPEYYPYVISLAGNVPVKVICDNPIKPGDSLVTSDILGYAIKLDASDITTFQEMQDRNDAVFAKALESCDFGKKIIRAWV